MKVGGAFQTERAIAFGVIRKFPSQISASLYGIHKFTLRECLIIPGHF